MENSQFCWKTDDHWFPVPGCDFSRRPYKPRKAQRRAGINSSETNIENLLTRENNDIVVDIPACDFFFFFF